MIELDQNDEYFQLEFGRFKNPPTHAQLIFMRWSMPVGPMNHGSLGFEAMLRPHVEAAYVYGRRDADGNFTQTPDDTRHPPAHAGLDMSDYDLKPNIGTDGTLLDSPARVEIQKRWARAVAIKETLLAHKEGPHVDDPTVRVPSPHGKNRFSEFDLDIVFSHTDNRLRGRAVE